MRNLSLRLLAAVCCVWAITGYAAKITLNPPPEVPTDLNAREFKEFTAKRNDLLTQLGEAREKVDSQARDCREVAEGSPKVDECRAKAQEVRTVVKDYRAALERFNASLAERTARQRSMLSNDGKLSVSARHPPRPIAIESHGEFHIVTADGRKLTGREAARLTEDDEARLVTGPGGGALLTLVDGTRIKLDSNTEYLTNLDKGKQSVPELVKGTLRWISKEASKLNRELNKSHNKLMLGPVYVGVRGTEFECAVLPDGSGHIKLYSGEIAVTSKSAGAVVTLTPGQMIAFTKDRVGAVTPIPGGV